MKMFRRIWQFGRAVQADQSGMAGLEYGLVVGLIGFGLISSLDAIGSELSASLKSSGFEITARSDDSQSWSRGRHRCTIYVFDAKKNRTRCR